MKDTITEGRKIATELSNILGLDKYFIDAASHIISNSIYARDKEILERERMQIVILLSKSIKDQDVLTKAIEDLGFKVKLKDLC